MRELERAAAAGGWPERRALLVAEHRARGCDDEVERKIVGYSVEGYERRLELVMRPEEAPRVGAVPVVCPHVTTGPLTWPWPTPGAPNGAGWLVRAVTCLLCGARLGERMTPPFYSTPRSRPNVLHEAFERTVHRYASDQEAIDRRAERGE